MITRRRFVAGLFTAVGSSLVLFDAQAGPRRRRRRRIRRRRIRRHVAWRTVGPVRRLVVPIGLAVGWELAVDKRVVIVKEIHEDHIIVVDPQGKTEQVDVIKENTEANAVDHEGSEYEEQAEPE